jgi:hypothetical protein
VSGQLFIYTSVNRLLLFVAVASERCGFIHQTNCQTTERQWTYSAFALRIRYSLQVKKKTRNRKGDVENIGRRKFMHNKAKTIDEKRNVGYWIKVYMAGGEVRDLFPNPSP